MIISHCEYLISILYFNQSKKYKKERVEGRSYCYYYSPNIYKIYNESIGDFWWFVRERVFLYKQKILQIYNLKHLQFDLNRE